MGTLGQTLKASREAKGLTTSESAAATRIKIQHIEAIEQDDFSKIPAPAYAKGFIKLYAEHLGLDPEPFIEAYMQYYAPKDRARIISDEMTHEEDAETGKKKKLKWLNAYKIPGRVKSSLTDGMRRMILVVAGLVVLLTLIVVFFKQCVGERDLLTTGDQPSIRVKHKPVGALIEEPADTYLDPESL